MHESMVVTNDLIFGTKITGTARQIGVACRCVADADALRDAMASGTARLVMVDMGLPGDEAATCIRTAASGSASPVIIAFYPHVMREAADVARHAGATEAMPRSRFSAELPNLIRRFRAACPPPV